MRVAWTGHRPDLFLDPDAARAALEAVAHDLMGHGAEMFLVGGQRGVDTWAAQAALREEIPFQVVLPLGVPEFTRDWTQADRRACEALIARAASVEIAGGYTERNHVLGTAAQLLVVVWTGTGGGGTAETIAFARQAGTAIREILLPAATTAGSAVGRGI